MVVNIRSSSQFGEAVFAASPRLRLISIWGTGTDNVDLGAASRRGIAVTNTPGVAAHSVAEHALALMLAVARNIPRLDAAVRGGEWRRGQSMELRGKTLGIVGLGAIGRAFARLGQGIGMRVIAWTVHPDPSLGFALVDRDELFRTADVVSLHVRLTPEMRGMVGRRELELMKPSAILINTARGALVDEGALVEALSTGRITGAGLDVFETEPLPAEHPLTAFSNVVLTPHCAGITPEALENGLRMAVENVLKFAARAK
jgi:phosphoglycerate dehydrogenase-like enzyme